MMRWRSWALGLCLAVLGGTTCGAVDVGPSSVEVAQDGLSEETTAEETTPEEASVSAERADREKQAVTANAWNGWQHLHPLVRKKVGMEQEKEGRVENVPYEKVPVDETITTRAAFIAKYGRPSGVYALRVEGRPAQLYVFATEQPDRDLYVLVQGEFVQQKVILTHAYARQIGWPTPPRRAGLDALTEADFSLGGYTIGKELTARRGIDDDWTVFSESLWGQRAFNMAMRHLVVGTDAKGRVESVLAVGGNAVTHRGAAIAMHGQMIRYLYGAPDEEVAAQDTFLPISKEARVLVYKSPHSERAYLMFILNREGFVVGIMLVDRPLSRLGRGTFDRKDEALQKLLLNSIELTEPGMDSEEER